LGLKGQNDVLTMILAIRVIRGWKGTKNRGGDALRHGSLLMGNENSF